MLRSKHVSTVVCFGLLTVLALSTAGCPATDEIVIFDDLALERAVRDELGQPFGFLTRQGLLSLQTLDAKGLGVSDLSGLEYCENLIWLDLDTNSISDLTPLTNLVNLMSLNLDSNEVFDIAPLAGLLNLDSLSLFDNQVGDIHALVTNAMNGGLGAGDQVVLDANTLSETALNVDVPQLESLGVNVILATPAGS
jgi:Leucine-rich repeat (LRR) protein